MNPRRHDDDGDDTANRQEERGRRKEMLVFLLVSVVGVYGLGQGLAGIYERGQQISLLWLAVTGLAFFVLTAQMGRVHDTWPHRPNTITTQPASADISSRDETPKEVSQ